MNEKVLEKLSRVASQPGVYLMKNGRGEVIYVGKARNLKKRLSSYFARSTPPDMKTGVLVKQVSDFDTIITSTEKEALILESNLIKSHRPRYNVVLKDDKRYPVLRMDVRRPYPNLTVARQIKNDGALYFGPYASAHAVRQTLKFIHKTFKLRKCRASDVKPRTRPCLHCQIDGCLAPCCNEVSGQDYDRIVDEVALFLKGRTPELIRDVRNEMEHAAEKQDFERAARLRDKMFSLEKTLERQVSVTADFTDRDVLGVAERHGLFMVTQLVIRSGFLVGSRNYDFSDGLAATSEIVEAFIKQHYGKSRFVPEELLLPVSVEDAGVLEEWLGGLKRKRVRILRPRRGEKARLIRMAFENAENALQELIAASSTDLAILEHLRERLHLDRIPNRIECFDNSNISGTEPVAGMVVFENSRPKKNAYRKFKIKAVAEHNDYGYMREVLSRRFGKGEKNGNFPDLLMVDGGKGQLNIAVSVIEELGLTGGFQLVGIAKKNRDRGETSDKIYVPGRLNPVNLSAEALLFLQRIRDEAHRFAVAFHRKRREKAAVKSVLDEVPGIGKKRKQALMKHFGSISRIKEATLEQIAGVSGMNRKAAEQVKETLKDL